MRDNQISNQKSENTRLAAKLEGWKGQIKELVEACNKCEQAKESLQKNIEKLETENEILKKMHVTQTEEHEKLKAEITDLQGQLLEKNNNEKHYQDEEKQFKSKIEKLHQEIAHNKESAETQIDMIQKIAKEGAEKLVKETIDQYLSLIHI